MLRYAGNSIFSDTNTLTEIPLIEFRCFLLFFVEKTLPERGKTVMPPLCSENGGFRVHKWSPQYLVRRHSLWYADAMSTKNTSQVSSSPQVIYVVGSFYNEYVIYRIFSTRELAEAYRSKHSDWHLSIKEEQMYNGPVPEDF